MKSSQQPISAVQSLPIPLLDQFQRPMQDLRISVIDRCNFRCTYCMPKEEYGQSYSFLRSDEWLTFSELLRLIKLFVKVGIRKVRLTGGEPLLRPQLPQLIKDLKTIPHLEDVALTTNGALLGDQAEHLFLAGLHRLTISLDTLHPETFLQMNGGFLSLSTVLNNILKAKAVGFQDIKINTVIQKGVNEDSILDLANFARTQGMILRFIEFMDVGNCNHWDLTRVVKSTDILKRLHKHFPLKPIDSNYPGEVAQRYAYCDGKGEVGVISSVSQPFCGSCTRLRLSTNGQLYTCLFANQGTDIMTLIRQGASDDDLLLLIQKIWSQRADKYSENRYLYQSLKMKNPKIEMYQIGG